MSNGTIFMITMAVIFGATVLSVSGKISKFSHVVILFSVLVWEYWMLGL